MPFLPIGKKKEYSEEEHDEGFDEDKKTWHHEHGKKKVGSHKKGHKKGFHEHEKKGKKGGGKKGTHYDEEEGNSYFV